LNTKLYYVQLYYVQFNYVQLYYVPFTMANVSFEYDLHDQYELELPKQHYIRKGLSGLVNAGNKCFLNSIIQCLSHTVSLTDHFLSQRHLKEDPGNTSRQRKKEYYIVMTYTHLLVNIWENNQLLKPKSFTENLSKFVPKYFTLQQQDSHECLMHILDLLHRGLSYPINAQIHGEPQNAADELMKQSLLAWKQNYENEYSVLVETFHGTSVTTTRCVSCHKINNTFEPLVCLSVTVPDSSCTLQSCLDTFFTDSEEISTWKCESCSKLACEKTYKAWSLPNHIIIHLKRFNNSGTKKNTHVEVPIDNLDMTPYISSAKGDPNNYMYSLYAVNYHSGTADSGHYWSACKNLDNNWYLLNDGDVSKCSGDSLAKDAYILFYHRKFIRKPKLL